MGTAWEAWSAGQHEGAGFAVWLGAPSFHGEDRRGEKVVGCLFSSCVVSLRWGLKVLVRAPGSACLLQGPRQFLPDHLSSISCHFSCPGRFSCLELQPQNTSQTWARVYWSWLHFTDR